MSDQNHNKKRHEVERQNDRQKMTYDPYDRFETIEFTKEDLEALRRPNPQPLDADYFTEEQSMMESSSSSHDQADVIDESSPQPSQDFFGEDDATDSPQNLAQEASAEESANLLPEERDPLEDLSDESHHAGPVSSDNGYNDNNLTDESFFDQASNFDEADDIEQEVITSKDSREHLQETLDMELEDTLFERHDFSQVDNGDLQDNPFAYRSVQRELRDRQAQQRVYQAKPGFMKGIMQTLFRTRADEERSQLDSQEENSFSGMMAETLSELGHNQDLGTDLEEGWDHSTAKSPQPPFEEAPDRSEVLNEEEAFARAELENSKDLPLIEEDSSKLPQSSHLEEEALDQAITDKAESSVAKSQTESLDFDLPAGDSEKESLDIQTFDLDWESLNTTDGERQPKTQMYDDDDLAELAADLPEYTHELAPQEPSKLQKWVEKSQKSLGRGWQQVTSQSQKVLSGIKQRAENVMRTEGEQFDSRSETEGSNPEPIANGKDQEGSDQIVDKESADQDLTEDSVPEEALLSDSEQELNKEDQTKTQEQTQSDKDQDHESPAPIEVADDESVKSIDPVEKDDAPVDAELENSEDEKAERSEKSSPTEEGKPDETGTHESTQVDQKSKNKELEDPQVLAERISQETQQYQEPLLSDSILESYTLSGEASHQKMEESDNEAKKSFVSNAAWLSFGSIFSRIIGALYIIPWATWLGAEYTQANSLYAVGYTPYAYFIALATAGFPGAVAKQIAYYNSKKEFKVSDKLFKYSLLVMLVTGGIAASIFFFAAPALAVQSSTDNPAAAVIVIRSLAPALLILPMMSLTRGYFQGFNNMMPFAVSEVIEQVVRVVYILGSTYLIMQVYHGSVTQAVAHSTFAAFVGAVGSVIFLIIIYLRHLPVINQLKQVSADKIQIDFKQSIQMMLKDSIPFILLGSGIILAQVIDTFTFKQILMRTSVLLTSEIAEIFGAMNLDVNKLVMIVVSLAVAMAGSSIPAVSSKFAQGNVNKTSELIKNIVLIFALVMLPAAVGMAMIADNLYPFFYPAGLEIGPQILVTGSIMAIALGAYTVLATILQSMSYRREAVTYLMIGIGIKVILQFPMVAMFRAHGAMFATTIAFTVTSVMMWMKIWRVIKIRDRYFVGDLIRIVIATAIMGIGASAWNRTLNFLMDPVGRGLTFVQIILVIVMAMLIYFGILALFGMLSILIGDRHSELQERLSLHK